MPRFHPQILPRTLFIHGTYTLEYRETDGVCLIDSEEEEEGQLLIAWVHDIQAIAEEAGVTEAAKKGKRPLDYLRPQTTIGGLE